MLWLVNVCSLKQNVKTERFAALYAKQLRLLPFKNTVKIKGAQDLREKVN